MYDADKEKLVFEHVIGEKADELTGMELEPDQGLAGVAFKNCKTLVSEDAAAERAYLRELGRSWAMSQRTW
ncbi:MAG: hypothetical protein GTO55_11670 [Armatimonadetes bacterium]|nr:hypothetical protein [Armatimonadota bacterium]NIM24874.1 hypothetical protein [Armatimonadota bacterium]NIM68764.1 hypothetical protein [Armatimonadota bacterium]NIM77025.1 hypothetical protein [Armatimonadota bacterium]NIN06960.1 hypothetical protein [Armatimonadota bacterium]